MTGLERRTPLKRVGKKARKDSKELAVARPVVERRSHLRCEFIGIDVRRCPRTATHIHHIQPRGRGGSNDPENLIHLCGDHHRWIHNNPATARELGYLV